MLREEWERDGETGGQQEEEDTKEEEEKKNIIVELRDRTQGKGTERVFQSIQSNQIMGFNWRVVIVCRETKL